jgi:hypothetical protein
LRFLGDLAGGDRGFEVALDVVGKTLWELQEGGFDAYG